MSSTPNSHKPSPQAGRPRPCPICSKLSLQAYRPFCSARCRQIDLNRWLNGGYAIPVVDADSDLAAGEDE